MTVEPTEASGSLASQERSTADEGDASGADPAAERGRSHRRRRGWLIAASAVLLAGVAVGSIALAGRLRGSDDSALVGNPAPAFTLPGLVEGSPAVSLAEFTLRPVVINFWASWCVPCQREMPDLQAAHVVLGDTVAFVGVDHEDDRTSALEFARYTGVTYPSGFDPVGTTAAEYGLVGLPTTVLVSADGRVVAEVKGALTQRRLLQLVSDRLGISPPES